MVIDFERAVLLEPPQCPLLAQLVPKKRALDDEGATSGSSKRSRARQSFQEDI